jgi:hypothetical protein
MKNKGLIIVVILLLIAWRRKKNNIVVDPVQPAHSTDADYLVQVRKDGKFYALDKTTVKGIAQDVQKVDGFNTNELPTWVKVRLNNVLYYVKVGDFKILR